MKVSVHGRNIEVTDWIEEYVEKKVKRVERQVPTVNEVRVEISQHDTRSAADRYTVQVTLGSNGQILRAEETSGDVYAAIDEAVDKLARQIERFKGRYTKERRRTSASVAHQSDKVVTAVEEAEEEPATGYVIRRKQFPMQAMTEDEALEQMELLGHDFFIYFNPDSRNANVIYKRRDGNYGILQPQLV